MTRAFASAALIFGLAVAAGAVPNPASVNCVKLKGRVEILESGRGQTGYCRLADRSLVEEWTLLRAVKSRNPVQAIEAFLTHPAARPAASKDPASERLYCLQLGGDNVLLRAGETALNICRFPDKSAIDAATLFAGPARRPVLAGLLKK